jgi:hypothetical protein
VVGAARPGVHRGHLSRWRVMREEGTHHEIDNTDDDMFPYDDMFPEQDSE